MEENKESDQEESSCKEKEEGDGNVLHLAMPTHCFCVVLVEAFKDVCKQKTDEGDGDDDDDKQYFRIILFLPEEIYREYTKESVEEKYEGCTST